MKKLFLSLAIFPTFALAATAPEPIQIKSIDANAILRLQIPAPADWTRVLYIVDGQGDHALVLSRTEGASRDRPNPDRNEYIRLTAKYYGRTAGGWAQEWSLMDYSDCPEMDIAGDFLYKYVTVTDLDKNGHAEVTLPYHMFCGTGVDPHSLKVIMRDGDNKYAVRGESLIKEPSGLSFGGDRTFDKVLNTPEKAAYKQHLDRVWKRVVSVMHQY